MPYDYVLTSQTPERSARKQRCGRQAAQCISSSRAYYYIRDSVSRLLRAGQLQVYQESFEDGTMVNTYMLQVR